MKELSDQTQREIDHLAVTVLLEIGWAVPL
jgi:hypothetical protein